MGLDLALGVIVLFAGIRGWLKGFVAQLVRLMKAQGVARFSYSRDGVDLEVRFAGAEGYTVAPAPVAVAATNRVDAG